MRKEKRKLIYMACLASVLACPQALSVAHCNCSEDNLSESNERYYSPYMQVGGMRLFGKTDSSSAKIDMFMPFWQEHDQMLFADIKAYIPDRKEYEGNFHIGYRGIAPETQKLYGVFAAFDHRKTKLGNYANQFTFDVEHWNKKWFLGINGYFPIGKSIFLNNEKHIGEEVKAGSDITIGKELTSNLSAYLSGYYFRGRNKSSIYGPKLKLTYDLPVELKYKKNKIFEKVSLETEFKYDKVRGVSYMLGVNARIGLGSTQKPLEGVAKHMVDMIRRDADIVTETYVCPPIIKPNIELPGLNKKDEPVVAETNSTDTDEERAAHGDPDNVTLDTHLINEDPAKNIVPKLHNETTPVSEEYYGVKTAGSVALVPYVAPKLSNETTPVPEGYYAGISGADKTAESVALVPYVAPKLSNETTPVPEGYYTGISGADKTAESVALVPYVAPKLSNETTPVTEEYYRIKTAESVALAPYQSNKKPDSVKDGLAPYVGTKLSNETTPVSEKYYGVKTAENVALVPYVAPKLSNETTPVTEEYYRIKTAESVALAPYQSNKKPDSVKDGLAPYVGTKLSNETTPVSEKYYGVKTAESVALVPYVAPKLSNETTPVPEGYYAGISGADKTAESVALVPYVAPKLSNETTPVSESNKKLDPVSPEECSDVMGGVDESTFIDKIKKMVPWIVEKGLPNWGN